MKRTIPKNIPNYTNITPDKLSTRPLNTNEKEIVAKFIKNYNRQSIAGIIIAIGLGLTFSLLCIYNGIFDFAAFIGCFICFLVAFFISRKIIPSTFSCKHIQVGQLHGVWSLRNNSSHNKLYYFDVIFPDSLTRIKNVNCTQTEYSKAKENDYILVFSYDGKISYGCIIR